jgi:uncharacterized membrane protein
MKASLHAAARPVQSRPAAALGASVALLALIVLAVSWEWWLAPLRPGGSALVLKAVPLLLALPGVWRRRLYTLQWASMLILLYFAEGVVRGWSDHGLSAGLGWLQAALAVIFFICTLAYVGPFKRAAKRAAKAAAKESGNSGETLVAGAGEPSGETQAASQAENPGEPQSTAQTTAPEITHSRDRSAAALPRPSPATTPAKTPSHPQPAVDATGPDKHPEQTDRQPTPNTR